MLHAAMRVGGQCCSPRGRAGPLGQSTTFGTGVTLLLISAPQKLGRASVWEHGELFAKCISRCRQLVLVALSPLVRARHTNALCGYTANQHSRRATCMGQDLRWKVLHCLPNGVKQRWWALLNVCREHETKAFHIAGASVTGAWYLENLRHLRHLGPAIY